LLDIIKFINNLLPKRIQRKDGFLDWLFGSKTTTYDPYSQYSPEQLTAVKALESLANTGSGGGITLGQQYPGATGDYQMTQGSQDALSNLQGLYGNASSTAVTDFYTNLLGQKFNPSDPSTGYADFSRALAKSGQESSDVLNREAAITGSRFGTGIQKQKASLSGDLANQRGMFLADLYKDTTSKQLQGASGLQNQQANQANLLSSIFNMSEVQRQLKDQELKDKLNQWQNARNEKVTTQIGLMQGIQQNPMGNIETTTPSYMSQLFSPDNVSKLIGTIIGTAV
jgi:hypothetical protein